MRKDPIIITGVGHSGTRGLVEILSASEELYLGDINNSKKEWEFYRMLARRINAELLGLPVNHDHNYISPAVYNYFYCSEKEKNRLSRFVQNEIEMNPLESTPPESGLWLIKTPRSVLSLEIWLDVFPNARVINLVRDGRDVALSLPDNCGDLNYRFNLWSARLDRIETYKRMGYDIQDIKYEDLETESGIRAVCSVVGVEYSQMMLNNARVVKGKGVKKFGKRIPDRFHLMRLGYIPER